MVKYEIGLTVGRKGQSSVQIIDLLKVAISKKDNSVYVVPLPSLFRGTGFHLSFHPSGVTHIRTNNPRISVDVPIHQFTKRLTPDAYKISAEPFLRPPRVSTPALITILSKRHIQKCLYPIGAHKLVIDLQKMFEDMTIYGVRDTSNLSHRILQLRRSGDIQEGDQVTIITTDTSEFSIFYALPSHDMVSKYLLPSKEESLRKLGGYFLTIENPMEGRFENFFRSPVFRSLFEPMEEFMNKLDKARVELANLNLNEDVLENILQKKKVLLL